MSDLMLTQYPKGWFVVAFSSEIPALGVKPLRYFGQRLVAFRGEDGVVHVLDAYCAHLGADLGVGGRVVGNSIECPFHAWRYGGSGECVAIPYASKIPARARQRAWLTCERNGLVLVHHDPDGAAPTYEIPAIPEYGAADWLPWVTNTYSTRTHPREIVENLADRAHFPRVHDTTIHEFSFVVAGHTATQNAKGKVHLPGAGDGHFSSTTTYHGPGYLIMRLNGSVLQNYTLVAHTPVDHGSVDLRLGVMLKVVGDAETTDSIGSFYMNSLKSEFEADIRIWENKLYREQPVLCDGDGPIGELRRWYRQFYREEDQDGG